MVDVFIKVLLFDILFSDIFSLKFSVVNSCRNFLSGIESQHSPPSILPIKTYDCSISSKNLLLPFFSQQFERT